MSKSKEAFLIVVPHNPDVPGSNISMLEHPALYRKLDILKVAFSHVLVITADKKTGFKQKGISNYRIPYTNSLRYTFSFTHILLHLLIRLRRRKVILCFDTSVRGLLTLLIARLLRKPFVSFFVRGPARVYGSVFKQWLSYRILLVFSNLVITFNPVLAERLSRIHFRHDILILPNYVDREFQSADCEKESGSIIHVGRLVPEKRIDYLLRAFARVVEMNKNVHFYIVGEGLESTNLKRETSRLSISRFVSFLGYLEKPQLIERLNRSEVFVFGSDSESFPNTVIEAISCGLPIVAPDIADLKWLIDGGAIFVNANDEVACANAISRILNDHRLRSCLSEKTKTRAKVLKGLLNNSACKVLSSLRSL